MASSTAEDIAFLHSSFTRTIPRPTLPDDTVEYSLYILSPTLDQGNIESETRVRLREVQRAAIEIFKRDVSGYIWAREGFGLEIKREEGVSFLHGRTSFGDSIADEWVVVWILRELSKRFSDDLWIQVCDGDGEFLLVEAAGVLPGWLEPEGEGNRVWIHNGGLHIIRTGTASQGTKRRAQEQKLSLNEAFRTILHEPRRLIHSTAIEEEAFYRLRNYPAQIQENMHHALLRLPCKVAFLLRQKPAYVAPAVEAFYLRDPIALKPLQQAGNGEGLVFRPEDLVTVSVKFPRVSYAQLRSQGFPAPKAWAQAMPAKTREEQTWQQAESGMKLACGFEMLVSDSQNRDKLVVREIRMLLDDLETGDESLPTDAEIEKWEKRVDEEGWLDISFEDLEGELAGRSREGGRKRGEFGDKAAQENLQRIVKQFEEFLNDDKAGLDGAGLFGEDSDDDDNDDDDDLEDESDDTGEDKEVSFDEDEFTKMMQEMMGMPSDVMREMMGREGESTTNNPVNNGSSIKMPDGGRIQELDSDDSDKGDDMETVMRRMEAELNETGVLNLDPTPRKLGATKRAIKGKGKAAVAEEDESADSDDGEENDVDLNLARNLLESLQGQPGMAGPAQNLMGLMGLNLPRDEGNGDERERPKR